ncbi:MAG: WbqC family protein [bacterium]
MILAAHSPNYLPLVDFFYKMSTAGVFVLADDIQYTKHNFINRTKIKTSQGVPWLAVPVRTKGRMGQLINQIQIDTFQNWRRKHWKTLLVNYKYAAYFEKYAEFFENLYKKPWSKLVELNLEIIEFIIQSLNISTKIYLSSELNVTGKGSHRLIKMLNKLGCDSYLTDQEGKKYLDQCLFKESGIKLTFFSLKYPVYHQQFGEFVPALSMVDVLFNEGENSSTILFDD